jgi:xylulokinase
MGGYVLSDGDLRPISNLVSWQDQRGTSEFPRSEHFDKIRDELEARDFATTGTAWRDGLPILGIRTDYKQVKIHEKWVFESIISWVTRNLADSQSLYMHSTDAASSGFFHIYENTWITEYLSDLASSLTLPKVLVDVVPIGRSKEFELDVFVGVGDQQASLLGAGIDDGTTVINIGTGGQVARLIHSGEENNAAQVRPFFGNNFISTKTHLPSGRALKTFVSHIYGQDSGPMAYAKFFAAASDSYQTSYRFNLDDYKNTVSELEKHFHDLDEKDIASSFMRSMGDIYIEQLSHIGHTSKKMLLFAGGVGQHFSTLSHYISTRTSSRYTIAKTEETTLQGLAELSRRALET